MYKIKIKIKNLPGKKAPPKASKVARKQTNPSVKACFIHLVHGVPPCEHPTFWNLQVQQAPSCRINFAILLVSGLKGPSLFPGRLLVLIGLLSSHKEAKPSLSATRFSHCSNFFLLTWGVIFEDLNFEFSSLVGVRFRERVVGLGRERMVESLERE